jgi:hypothetical protein
MVLRLMVVAMRLCKALASSGWGVTWHTTSSSRLLGVSLAPTTCEHASRGADDEDVQKSCKCRLVWPQPTVTGCFSGYRAFQSQAVVGDSLPSLCVHKLPSFTLTGAFVKVQRCLARISRAPVAASKLLTTTHLLPGAVLSAGLWNTWRTTPLLLCKRPGAELLPGRYRTCQQQPGAVAGGATYLCATALHDR